MEDEKYPRKLYNLLGHYVIANTISRLAGSSTLTR